jgi:hypothetical protein
MNNFVISIPQKEEEAHNYDNKHNENSKPLAKLLVVDDDADIVHVLKLGLLRKGFLVNSLPILKTH